MTLIDEPDPTGATPLTPEDVEGLPPTWVATRADLNLAEQANIEAAFRWAFEARRPVRGIEDLLTPQFSDRLHRRMFDDVWAWAGKRRRRLTNIGVDPSEITARMKLALDDAIFWHIHHAFDSNELAVRTRPPHRPPDPPQGSVDAGAVLAPHRHNLAHLASALAGQDWW